MLSQGPRPILAGPSAPIATSPTTTTSGDEPACLSCRRRKLRCSRERPACGQCIRLSSECVYDQKRQKPGLKAGAIDSINQRLDLIEQRLDNVDSAQRVARTTQAWPSANATDTDGCVYHASLLVANHLKRLSEVSAPNGTNDLSRDAHSSNQLLNCSRRLTTDDDISPRYVDETSYPRKKRRLDSTSGNERLRHSSEGVDPLPSQKIVDAAIVKYFATVHHWLPMVHERRFRARLADGGDSKNLSVVIHAMIVATLKHLDPGQFEIDIEAIQEQVHISRNFVMLNAFDKLSVENAQSLIILAFEYMGSGEWSRAWPLIGALTRIVDYLQLTTEPGEAKARPLLPPLAMLHRPKTHAEKEERKRVFWNTFLLDRLCSLVCGWSTGFTSDNVSRQLPCNGAIWRNNEEATTPYFGLWEKSQGKIGKSVAYLPTHRASPNDQGQPGASPASHIDISNLGAVAYRIEAAESLSQVSSFFLQQHVNFTDRAEIKDWLTRFKELDLRLVHWKLFLPQRWKESKVARDAIVKMDMNLTLSHITHNTSMILLHQHIAYPSSTLSRAVNLPSSCSAETCELAAVETAAITWKYLQQSQDMMLNTEFVFCTFVAAKVLLVHSHFYKTELANEFFQLIESLEEMSRRWRGFSSRFSHQAHEDPSALDLAGVYALQLREYDAKCRDKPAFAFDILQHSAASALLRAGKEVPLEENVEERDLGFERIAYNTPSDPGSWRSSAATRADISASATPMHHMPKSSPLPPLTPSPHLASRGPASSYGSAAQPPTSVNSYQDTSTIMSGRGSITSMDDNLVQMSEALMGQGFANMDRVITFDGTPFSFDPFQFADFSYNSFDLATNP